MSDITVAQLVEKKKLRVEDGNHGNDRPRSHEFVDHGVNFIRAADMTSGKVDFSNSEKINATAFNRIRKGIGEPGDVLVTHKGTIGKVAFVSDEAPEFVCSPQTTFWRSLDQDYLNQSFIGYWLKSTEAQQQFRVLGGQSDMAPYVSLTSQRSMTITVPEVSRQRAIADVLGALDDKIAANERILDLRQQLTRSLYRSAPKPRTKPLSSVASFINGRAFTKNATGTGRVVIRIAELNSGVGASTVWNDIDVDESNTAQPGDLLFAWSGSLTVARWFEPEAIVNQHIFKVETRDETPMWLVRELLNEQLERFKSIAADKATTMGHIKRSHLDEPVHIPDDAWLVAHQDVMSSVWDLEFEVELEKRRLARTRDELLPLLMSGKITVKDAEAVVSDAV
jgi:type I restriction enzyme S subunit